MIKRDQSGVLGIHLLWFLIALCVLPNGGHFLLDEAIFFHQAISASRGLWFPTLGPMISGTQPLAFTPGGAFALILAPFFWLSSDPRAGVIGITLLSCLGGVLWDRVLVRLGENRLSIRLGVAAILAFLPWHARMTDRIWNVQLFSFLTPLFFYMALRLVQSRSSREGLLWGFGTGAVFGSTTQIHLGAVGLPVAALGLLASPEDRKFWVQRFKSILPGLLLGIGLVYTPYLVRELGVDGQNTRSLFDSPKAGQGWSDLLQAALAPARFMSVLRFDWDTEQLQFEDATLVDAILLATGGVCFAMGLRKNARLRAVVLLSLAWLPLFFAASGRRFYPHYVAGFAPLWMFASAEGIVTVTAGVRTARIRIGLALILASLLLGGTVRWVEHYGKRAFGVEKIPTIPLLLEQSRAQAQHFATKDPERYRRRSEDEGLRLPYLESNPAISMLQASLLQWVQGQPPVFIRATQTSAGTQIWKECQIHFALPGRSALDAVRFEPQMETSPLYYEAVLACRPRKTE